MDYYFIDASPMIRALRQNPSEFEMRYNCVRHRPSRHWLGFDPNGTARLSAHCSCAEFPISAEQSAELRAAVANWKEIYWRPLMAREAAARRVAEINREFARHFQPKNSLAAGRRCRVGLERHQRFAFPHRSVATRGRRIVCRPATSNRAEPARADLGLTILPGPRRAPPRQNPRWPTTTIRRCGLKGNGGSDAFRQYGSLRRKCRCFGDLTETERGGRVRLCTQYPLPTHS